MTRLIDHRHHWWDVLVGNVIGLLFGLFVVVVSCRHFRLRRIANITATRHAFNESLENGQIISFDKPQKHSVRKLLNSAVVGASENREMKNVATTWKE
jgi:hypothetical protein